MIIASRVGLGKVAINRKPVAINQDLKALTLRGDELLSRYLLLFLLSNAEYFERAGVGATVKGLTIADYQKLKIAVPPLTEQQRIVKLLDEADELRKLRAEADRRTTHLIPALFHEMFGDAVGNPNGWAVRRLEDVVMPGRIVTYGIVQAGPNIADGVPYIRTGDLKDGAIKVDGLLRTSRGIAANYDRSEVKTGDIVMSIRATVGTTAVVPRELNGANLTQGTARISPGPDMVTDYLLWFLRMPSSQSWI